MVSSGETNLLQKSDCQTLQHIISKESINIIYWIDTRFFYSLNDRHHCVNRFCTLRTHGV